MTFRPSVRVSWKNHCLSFVTDGKDMKCDTTLCCVPKVYGWLQTARNIRLAIILPLQQVHQYCSATFLEEKMSYYPSEDLQFAQCCVDDVDI